MWAGGGEGGWLLDILRVRLWLAALGFQSRSRRFSKCFRTSFHWVAIEVYRVVAV